MYNGVLYTVFTNIKRNEKEMMGSFHKNLTHILVLMMFESHFVTKQILRKTTISDNKIWSPTAIIIERRIRTDPNLVRLGFLPVFFYTINYIF